MARISHIFFFLLLALGIGVAMAQSVVDSRQLIDVTKSKRSRARTATMMSVIANTPGKNPTRC